MMPGVPKSRLAPFLARNPFPAPLTFGFFYREKMRAVHRVSPEGPLRDILEVGGGRGGLTALLYPGARIVNIDFDRVFGNEAVNRQPGMSFVCGDATRLPFPDASFDAVTMFDVLEHIPDDRTAADEAFRVLRPGGWLLASSPNEHWRFPYYDVLRPYCPSEEEMFAEWGHVRRGYSLAEFAALADVPLVRHASFINPLTVLCHDVAFSRLSERKRRLLCRLLAPLTWAGYALHHPHARGTETAVAWRKPAAA